MMSSTLSLTPIPDSSLTSAKDSGLHSSRIPFENSRTMDECRVEVLRKFRKEIVETVRFCDVSRVLIACGLVSKEECFEICKLPMPKQMTQCFQKVHDIMDILVCQKATAYERGSGSGNSVRENNTPRRIGSERRVEETDRQNGLVKDIWRNFTSALRAEHVRLAEKMEEELDKSAESRLLLKKGKDGSIGSCNVISNNGNSNSRSILRKEDIGCPRDFQHVQHYGVTSDMRQTKGKQKRELGDGADVGTPNNEAFKSDSVEEDDAVLQEFFKRAGVVSRHLLNPVTKQIICKFIAENGGMDAIRDEVRYNSQFSVALRHNQEDLPKSTSSSNVSLINQAPVPFEPTPRPTSKSFYF